jgi:hypothetical protein
MVGFVDTHDNQKNYSEKLAGKDAGPYVGTVKFTDDPLRQGRLGVNIPELTRTNNPTLDDCIWCQYLSPFYGAKSIEATNPSDPSDYRLTQHSYGMWFVPPDIDTQVLVMFVRGEASQKNAFWIGCVQQPLTNQQVPGYGASTFTELAADRSTGRERGAAANRTGETQNYGTDLLPVGEKNRRMVQNAVSAESANSFRYPVNRILADQLESQGLIQDPVRGTTTSSAKREAPSQVFGINTPGRIRDDSRELNIGPEGTLVKTDRNPGHSFVMDDGAADGTNQLTRLRTASGHQLLMHDTDGVVYLANGSGKAFIEMAKDGTISVYSDGGINLRSGRDFNIHSDMNINFHAKGAINFTSETNVALNAEGYLFAMGDQGVFTSSQNGSVRTYARDGISSDTKGSQLHGARGGDIHLAASGTGPAGRFGGQIHFNSTSPSDKWGPIWLKPDSEYVRIKVTGGEAGEDALIDIDDDQPYINGVVNKRANKTTVTDFVTHEPYGRKSSTQYKKDYVNQAIEQIKKTSPEISSTELKLIKAELLKQPTVKAVADKLGKVVKLNDNIKLPVKDLNNLLGKAAEIQSLINDPKLALQNFVYGKVAELKSTAVNFLKSKFKFF